MDQKELESLLANLNLSEIRFFESVGSTNDEAMTWARKGAHDLSLVVADEQTMGRGRLDRPWFTPPRTALAFSLILRPTQAEKMLLPRIVGLAAYHRAVLFFREGQFALLMGLPGGGQFVLYG